jgi:hypothetical protein
MEHAFRISSSYFCRTAKFVCLTLARSSASLAVIAARRSCHLCHVDSLAVQARREASSVLVRLNNSNWLASSFPLDSAELLPTTTYCTAFFRPLPCPASTCYFVQLLLRCSCGRYTRPCRAVLAVPVALCRGFLADAAVVGRDMLFALGPCSLAHRPSAPVSHLDV